MDDLRDRPLLHHPDREEYDTRPSSDEEVAERYLHAAWRAADRWDGDLAERMVHGAHTFMRLANEEYYREEMEDERDEGYDPDRPYPLDSLVRAIPAALSAYGTPCEETLVVYPMSAGGGSLPDWMWMEGFGLVGAGWMVDDGEWREMFDDEDVARKAVDDWESRSKGFGRGLPYVDDESRIAERVVEGDNEQTPPERLVELAQDRDYRVACAVVCNVNAPTEALHALAGHEDCAVWDCLATRVDLPDEVVDLLAANASDESVALLAVNGLLTDALLARVADDEYTRRAIMRELDFDEGGYALPLLSILVEDHQCRVGVLSSVPEKVEAELLRAAEAGSPWVEAYRGRLEELNMRIPPGALRRTYVIAGWSDWDAQVNSFAHDFEAAFGLFPNLLVGNSVTLRRIDMAANPENIRSIFDGREPEGYAPLSTFSSDGYVLEFAESDELSDNQVAMIWNGDPNGGGMPTDDTLSVEEMDARGLAQTG